MKLLSLNLHGSLQDEIPRFWLIFLCLLALLVLSFFVAFYFDVQEAHVVRNFDAMLHRDGKSNETCVETFYKARAHCIVDDVASTVDVCNESRVSWEPFHRGFLFRHRPPHFRSLRAQNLSQCIEETLFDQENWSDRHRDLREEGVLWFKYLQNMTLSSSRPMFFLEIGGYDGVAESNTIALARCAGWHGVLVEANSNSFRVMVETRPDSHLLRMIPNCKNSQIRGITGGGTGNELGKFDGGVHLEAVHCGSLVAYLQQLHVPYIDFWSLDVENTEQEVLEAFDFNLIPVRYLLVEVTNRFQNHQKMDWLKYTFAPSNNFIFLRSLSASWLFESNDYAYNIKGRC